MHAACNIRMQWVCIEHKWCTGAITTGQLRCPPQGHNSQCSCHCRWVFTQAPAAQHLSALSKGKKSREALAARTFDLTWEPLLHLLSSCHHPPSAEELSKVQRPPSVRSGPSYHPTVSPGPFILAPCDRRRHHPKPGVSWTATTSSLCGLQWIRDGIFLLKVEPLLSTEVSFLTRLIQEVWCVIGGINKATSLWYGLLIRWSWQIPNSCTFVYLFSRRHWHGNPLTPRRKCATLWFHLLNGYALWPPCLSSHLDHKAICHWRKTVRLAALTVGFVSSLQLGFSYLPVKRSSGRPMLQQRNEPCLT